MKRKECFLKVLITIADEKRCHASCSYLNFLGRDFGCSLNQAVAGIEPLEDFVGGGWLRTEFCSHLKEWENNA